MRMNTSKEATKDEKSLEHREDEDLMTFGAPNSDHRHSHNLLLDFARVTTVFSLQHLHESFTRRVEVVAQPRVSGLSSNTRAMKTSRVFPI